MQYSAMLKEAVETRNKSLAKAAIVTVIEDDRNIDAPIGLKLADEVNVIFAKNGEPLFEEEDHRLKVPEKNEWNKAFWNRIKGSLGLNFSRERIALATEVMLYLRAKGDPDFQPISTESSSTPEPQHCQAHGNWDHTLVIAAGVVIGTISGIAVGVALKCAIKAAVIGATVGAVGGAALGAARKHKENRHE